jgi:hypothetical protein
MHPCAGSLVTVMGTHGRAAPGDIFSFPRRTRTHMARRGPVLGRLAAVAGRARARPHGPPNHVPFGFGASKSIYPLGERAREIRRGESRAQDERLRRRIRASFGRSCLHVSAKRFAAHT